jgi:hypothetical protein
MNDENTSIDVKTEDSDLMSETSSQSDCMSGYSKKIVKKRKKYSKIDDSIRMKLLEDVANNGDTLKAAAERYNVNYSSAKSIFHTYRKEGRILKKPAREKARRKPLQAPKFDAQVNASPLTVSDKNSNQNGNTLGNAEQVLTQFHQIQTLTTLLKAAQENSILQQLQNIQQLLQKTCLPQESAKESAKEGVQQLHIPKPIRPFQFQALGAKSSSTPTNKQPSLFSKFHKGNETRVGV